MGARSGRHRPSWIRWLTAATCSLAVALVGLPALGQTPVVAGDLVTTECRAVSGIAVTYPTEEIRVEARLSNAVAVIRDTGGLRTASGLDFPDAQGASHWGFEATLENANRALASLAVRASASGSSELSLRITPAGAAYNPANGHFYRVLPGPLSWSAALTASEAATFDGISGYLATVTSAEENTFIASVSGVDAWLGASDIGGSFVWQAGPEKGQPLTYTNWLPGEPNDFGGREEFLSLKSGGGWNDLGAAGSGSNSLGAAVAEFNRSNHPPATVAWTWRATGDALAGITSCDPTPRVSIQTTRAGSQTEPSEFSVTGVPSVANPYDPAHADLWASIGQPDGTLIRVPAFWMRPFVQGTATGAAGWFVRFKASQSGVHTITIAGLVDGVRVVSDPLTFTPVLSTLPPIRVKGDGFFAGEEPWVPISYNMGWATRGEESALYESWFRKAAANGVNSARLWMPSWGTGIEWNDTGLGNYERRQSQAGALDDIFRLAAKYDIRIVLVFLNHGAFSLTTNSEWAHNPYNVANGGPLSDPGQFVTNPVAVGFWERRLRYIAARWAASPALFSWEWWNEVDFTPISSTDLSAWIARSSEALAAWDPYDHLTTTSWASAPATRDWSTVDWVSVHLYDSRDPLISIANIYEALVDAEVTKPILMAELGSSATGEDATLDPRGLHMRMGQWAGVFVGTSGPASYWWWDVYVDKQGLWGSTRGLATLLKGHDLAQLTPTRLQTPKDVVGRALVGPEATLVWLRHRELTREALIRRQRDAAIVALRTGKTMRNVGPPVFRPKGKVHLVIPVRTSGAALVTFVHPVSGKRLRSIQVETRNGSVSVPLSEFSGDVAMIVSQGRK